LATKQIKIKKCRACGREFEPSPNKASSAYCSNAECQKAKLRRPKNVIEFRNDKILKEDMVLKRVKKKKTASGRVCRKCGKDPYPNYFYCPACHKKIHSTESDSEEAGYEEWE
jgi:uncharacterized OB-fold protein